MDLGTSVILISIHDFVMESVFRLSPENILILNEPSNTWIFY